MSVFISVDIWETSSFDFNLVFGSLVGSNSTSITSKTDSKPSFLVGVATDFMIASDIFNFNDDSLLRDDAGLFFDKITISSARFSKYSTEMGVKGKDFSYSPEFQIPLFFILPSELYNIPFPLYFPSLK